MDSSITIRRATLEDVDLLVPLFDAYRQFYRKPSDPALARAFLSERLERGESTIFLATEERGAAVGFTQLYPTFSSASAAPILVLNDLYVSEVARRKGIASMLLRAAGDYAKSCRVVRMTLSTEITNTGAQALYEREGWRRQDDFLVYNLPVPASE